MAFTLEKGVVVEFKKIKSGSFRELIVDRECRILFMRHGRHNNNLIPESERRRLRRQGRQLAKAGVNIAHAISSPLDRAIASVIETKAGLGSAKMTETDEFLLDLSSQDPEFVKRIKEEAKKADMNISLYLFDKAQKDGKTNDLLFQRGIEGATTLKAAASQFQGKTVLVASHSTARMEQTIFYLTNPEATQLGPIEYIIEMGQMVEIILDCKNSKVIELNYIESPE